MTDSGKFYTNYAFESLKESIRILTSSFEEVPTNTNKLSNITMNGIIRPSENAHEVKMIFTEDIPSTNKPQNPSGTFVYCDTVYNARKIMTTRWLPEENALLLIIDLRKYKLRTKRPVQFSFTIQISDNSNFYTGNRCYLSAEQCFPTSKYPETPRGGRGGCCSPLFCVKNTADLKYLVPYFCSRYKPKDKL